MLVSHFPSSPVIELGADAENARLVFDPEPFIEVLGLGHACSKHDTIRRDNADFVRARDGVCTGKPEVRKC